MVYLRFSCKAIILKVVKQSCRVAHLIVAFSPEEIGNAVERSPLTVSQWQTGRFLPPRGLLAKLATVTGVDERTLREAYRYDRLERKNGTAV